MQEKINIAVPLNHFGRLATLAALDGVDITRWVKRKIIQAAKDGTLARHAATLPQNATPAAPAIESPAPAGV